MKQGVVYINPASLEISVEEFDALEGAHEFSQEYKKRKREMLRQYKKRTDTSDRRIYMKAAAAVVILTVSVPLVAQAATNGEFFKRIWGNLAREDVVARREVIYDEQDLPHVYTFPKREYVDIDPGKAEELIGAHVFYKPVVNKLGDTTLTILSSVHDGNAAVIEFKVEREGGVNAFNYSQIDNEYHGAEFSQDVDFEFHFPDCSEHIIVDLEKSTKDVLYCYNYMTMEPHAYDTKSNGITLEMSEYPCTRREMFEADSDTFDRYKEQTKTSQIVVPLRTPVEREDYKNDAGGITSISPLSLKIDTDTGLGLEGQNEELYDEKNIYYVSVNYKDGTKYVVCEHKLKGVHSCKVKIDNTSFISYDATGNLIFVFNRLVDPQEVQSITVNETIYTK